MCEITTALIVASTVIAGAGTIYAADANAKASEFNAKVSLMNATLADRRAKDAEERGKVDEQRKRMELARIRGTQEAAMAANGVDLGFGSPLDTLVDDAVIAELDALTVRRNAAREAHDYRVQGYNYRADAALGTANAHNTRVAGYFDAGSTVLGGAGKGYDDYWSRRSIGTIG